MDPATSDPLHSAVEIQGAMLGRHKQELSAARHAVETLATQVSNLTEQVHHLRLDPPATSRAFESPEPRINNPPCYSGEPTECRSFLTQCDIVFSLQPNTYSRSTARVAYVISLLIGRAREWGTAIWEARAECINQYQDFKEEMIRVFDRSVFGEEASRALSSLCQGNRSITDYSIEFRTLAVSSGWNEPALLARLLEGFRAEVKDEILSREVPSSVDSLIELAIRIERRVDLRHRARGKELALSVASLSASLPSSSAGSGAEPMQLGGIRISTKERERRITNRLCLYCGSAGHFVTSCPVKGQSSSVSGGLLVSATTPVSPSRSCTTLSVHLRWTGSSASCSALIDSGAEGCFMDETWAREHDIPLRQLKEPTALFALDGSPLPRIQRETLPLTLTVSGNHSETISFLIFRSPFTPVVLGHPWLVCHNPSINWSSNSILSWNVSCHVKCLMSAIPPVSSVSSSQEEPGDLTGVPEEYHDLRTVFSRSRATSLPPHRSYDCSIDLLPGTTPPRGRLYSLSAPERKALEDYLSVALDAGTIVPSSSPAGAGFFFVKKKDGSLRPCIDYRGLNDITVKNRYPLPLMSSAFEILQGARFFARFEFVISYRPGSKNTKPDALSRLFSSSVASTDPEGILPEGRVVGLTVWGIERQVKQALSQTPSPRACPRNLLFVPVPTRLAVLQWAHSAKLAGHPGVRGTLASIRQRFWWPTREHDTRRFVAACSVCAQTKSGNSPPAGRLRPLPIPSRPWSHIALDFVTGLPSSAGKTVILTVVDRFSKAAHFIPLAKLPSAKETAQIIIENVFRIHGLPSDVVSDRGPQFTSQFWREFCRLIGASVSLSSGFHPQSNGQAERANQTIGRILRSLSFRNPASWSEQLPWAEYAHNSLPSSATGLSPFQSSLGYQPPLFSSQFAESSVPSAQAFVQRCERTWKRVRSALCRYRAQTVRAANKRRTKSPRYCRGQRVWLSTQNLPLKTASRKLTPRFIGPFRISQVINPVAVRLLLPRYLRRVHPVFHVSCVKPVLRAPARLPPPPPHPCRGRTYLQGP
uniref:Gypsy retrotransposon integrase-like protein 1 n=2 Tax=Oncorhynchus mykiss TaxID=8022 RepID=A0A8K9XLT0_ONCMY